MGVGEKIQTHRKRLGLSQEKLGQKLLVSRQTISLWEKDQTVPTIDNLIQLKDIFGISIDEILDVEDSQKCPDVMPDESYQFNYSKAELNELHRLQRKTIYKRPVVFILICVTLIVLFIGSAASDLMIGFAFGMLAIGATSHFRGIRAYNKAWENSLDRICESTYQYEFFEKYIAVSIYRENEKIRQSKCYYTDIEQMQLFGKWLIFQFGGQSFIIRKSDLKENSAVYSYMYKNPTKAIENPFPDKWRIASTVLFIASLFSIWGAIALLGTVSNANGLFTENMWLFFLMTPIPIASVVLGFVLKAKGYKYKKNIIVGIIMTLFLCIYGSFSFMF